MMNLTVKELKAKAKEMNIKGYSAMKKAELVEVIELALIQEETKEIIAQTPVQMDKMSVCSACKCTGYLLEDGVKTGIHRSDLVAICINHSDYYIVERSQYSNEGVFYGGNAVKINKNIWNLATLGCDSFYIRRYDLFKGVSLEEIKAIIQWIKNLNLEAGQEVEQIEFNPENTAIATKFSTTAKMVAESVAITDRVLDYGCGTGRNIEYIANNSVCSAVDGTDIPEQLEKEKKRHDKLREVGHTIEHSQFYKDGHYDHVLNSHVLNVIHEDEVKKIVVDDIYKKLKRGGKAYFEVRTKSDVEGAKTKEKHGDGWKIKKGSTFTYQEAITKEKMTRLIEGAGFKILDHIYNASKHIVVATK